jgi:hypothetical protein
MKIQWPEDLLLLGSFCSPENLFIDSVCKPLGPTETASWRTIEIAGLRILAPPSRPPGLDTARGGLTLTLSMAMTRGVTVLVTSGKARVRNKIFHCTEVSSFPWPPETACSGAQNRNFSVVNQIEEVRRFPPPSQTLVGRLRSND